MEYYVKSVVPIIESNYDKFTTVERNIADFFIQNRKKVDFSSKSISERLFVSEASLSRFAKKCGYRGYREFIYQYEETFVEKQESITGNTRMILNAYHCKDQQISESGGACVRVRNRKFRSGSKRDGTAFYANRCGY